MESLPEILWEQVACPLCGCEQATVRLRAGDVLHGLPGEFQLVRCNACAHHYLNPRPTPGCIHDFYPQDYAPHHLPTATKQPPSAEPAATAPAKTPWYLSRPMRGLPGVRRLYHWLSETYAQVLPEGEGRGRRALEIGCADGDFLDRLRQRGWEAQGVELMAEPASRARQRGFEVHTGAFEVGQFPAGHFDAVFAWMVLEHLHDPRGMLRETRRILKRPGFLALSVPNFASWEPKVFGRYWYALQLPTHLHQFTAKTVCRMLREAGFENVRVIHQRNILNLPGSLALWLRRRFPRSAIGPALLRFTHHPGLWGDLAMAPWAVLLAGLRQGGRLTFVAQDRDFGRDPNRGVS